MSRTATSFSHAAFLSKLESLRDVVCMIDNKGVIIYVNQAVTRRWGYTVSELLGRNIMEYVSREDVQRSQMALERLQRGEAVGFFINRIRDKNGNEAEFEWYNTWDDDHRINFGIAKHLRSDDPLSQARTTYELREERQLLLTSAVIDAEEKIRSTISRELHDNVNQALTAIKWQLSSVINDKPSHREVLSKAVQHLENSIEEIRNLSKALSISSIEQGGLMESVRDLGKVFEEQKDIHIDVSSELDETLISRQCRIAAFRIIQEHLTNVTRHSDATEASISLKIKNAVLHVLITDNSYGFTLQAKRKGIGISNMIGRAEALKGTLTISTAPGEGCIVRLQLPLPDHAD